MILAKWGVLQKPFWESTEEIDVGLVADAMVTSFRFLGEEECIPIISQALQPEMSDAVKISAIKACITLVTEVSSRSCGLRHGRLILMTFQSVRLPWQKPLEALKMQVIARLYGIFNVRMFSSHCFKS